MKLFQVNATNFIAVGSVSGITIHAEYGIVTTNQGAKHRVTLEQIRALISCFEIIKPLIDLPALDNN